MAVARPEPDLYKLAKALAELARQELRKGRDQALVEDHEETHT